MVETKSYLDYLKSKTLIPAKSAYFLIPAKVHFAQELSLLEKLFQFNPFVT